jgi:peptidoglycan/xylan/chitin deacetylase (PgdA/CDA1 family)
MSLKYRLIRAAFEGLALSGLTGPVRRLSSCRGVIFTLHRVLPEPPEPFSPNAILQVTPEFLAFTIERVRRLGFDIVDLDEALRRIAAPEAERPFAVFTFDDAYRDNLVHALPVLERLDCPFTVYVPTGLVEGQGEIWWQALEDILAAQVAISVPGGERETGFDLTSVSRKREAYAAIYARMRRMREPARVAFIRELADRYGYDLARQCRKLIMDWDELELMAGHRLCSIGAHTVHHYELAKLPEAEARREIEDSVGALASRLGRVPRHLSYPIGDAPAAGPREYALAAELGFASAVTTRPGGLYAAGRQRLTALPRISLNGLFQARRYVDVFATGAIFSALRSAAAQSTAID